MTPVLEGVTHAAVVMFYLAALTMGLVAHLRAQLWARKLSTVGIIVTSIGWLCFYIFVVDKSFTTPHASVIWSRIFHYNTATWMFIMAFLIWRSDTSHTFDRINSYIGDDHA